MRSLYLPALFLFYLSSILAQAPSSFIHVDQFGYRVDAEKVAVISDPQIGYNSADSYTPSATLELRNALTNAVVFTAAPISWENGSTHIQSGDRGWWFDSSTYTLEGEYYIHDVVNNASSSTFRIADDVYHEILLTAGRAFYYNRCNSTKSIPFADSAWMDGMNFLNTLQDSNCRYIYDPTNNGLEKDLSGGWFDAGDYNKYVTFAHDAIHNLLWAYRENPQAFGDDWNIPESGNGIPDILDEIKWELDWLLKMSNPDGSTHIKMGSQNHSENSDSPPSLCTDQRFFGPVCSSASIAAGSMFAHAAMVFADFPLFSTYAQTLHAQAENCWNYVLPMILSNQLETACDDGSIVAGDADWDVVKQLENSLVAAIHLFDLTDEQSYHDYILDQYAASEQVNTPFWGPYKMPLNDALLHYTTLNNANSTAIDNILTAFDQDINNNYNGYYGFNPEDLYRAYMPDWSYHWGSNMPKANYAILNQLAVNYQLDSINQNAYTRYLRECIHYFHGVNPQGLVYLSNMYGLGAERSCDEIYHTWFQDGSDWDNAQTSVYGPAPGYVSGGPNSQFSVDYLIPPYAQPQQKSYLDFNTGWPDNSWEVSEPAIYYQAAYIRMLANQVSTSLSGTQTHFYADEPSIEIFPNPVGDLLIIRGMLEAYKIDILDNTGTIVENLSTTSSEVIINTSLLSPGLYFIRLLSNNYDHLWVEKIIKQ
jgi:hypothetical protein